MFTKTLLIDNYDSFTYNLYSFLSEVNGCPPTVVRNDVDWRAIELTEFDNIVISPGPGLPQANATSASARGPFCRVGFQR